MSITTALLSFASLGLFATFFAQATVSAIRQLRTAGQDRTIRDKTQSFNRRIAKLARLESQIVSPQNGKRASSWRVMEVREIEQESDDCKSFYLADPHGEDLPDFLPGQYLMVRPALASAKQLTRCYSLSDSPQKKYWRITVKKQSPQTADEHAAGGLSIWLHDRIGVGDCLMVGGPAGQFFLPRTSDSPLVLLAAGVGVTPITSMLRWSLEHTPNRPVLVLFQAQDAEHWPFGERLHRWQSQCRCLQVVSYFSREQVKPSAENSAAIRLGKFGANDITELFDSWKSADYFICGPDSWMTSLRSDLVSQGVTESKIHWESFGNAPAKSAPILHSDKESYCITTPCKVYFSLTQSEAEWTEPEQTLWELARATGVEITSGCLSGACGSCKVRLLKGRVEYSQAVTAEIGDGECLTCIARPTCDLVLEA